MKPAISHQLDVPAQTLRVTAAGDWVGAGVDAARGEFFRLLELPEVRELAWHTVQLDLTAMRHIDSLGLNLLVSLLREVQHRNGKLQVLIGNPELHRTFTHLQFDKQMELKLV